MPFASYDKLNEIAKEYVREYVSVSERTLRERLESLETDLRILKDSFGEDFIDTIIERINRKQLK